MVVGREGERAHRRAERNKSVRGTRKGEARHARRQPNQPRVYSIYTVVAATSVVIVIENARYPYTLQYTVGPLIYGYHTTLLTGGRYTSADRYARFRHWVSSNHQWRPGSLIWKVLAFGSARVRKGVNNT